MDAIIAQVALWGFATKMIVFDILSLVAIVVGLMLVLHFHVPVARCWDEVWERGIEVDGNDADDEDDEKEDYLEGVMALRRL